MCPLPLSADRGHKIKKKKNYLLLNYTVSLNWYANYCYKYWKWKTDHGLLTK